MGKAVIILQACQGGEQLLSRFSSIPRAMRRVAIVAFAARIGGASFIEILQEDFAATRVSICKVTHAAQLVEEEVFLIFGFVIRKIPRARRSRHFCKTAQPRFPRHRVRLAPFLGNSFPCFWAG